MAVSSTWPSAATSPDARRVLARRARVAARLAGVQGDAHAAAAGRAVDEVDRRRDRGVRAREDAEHGAAAALDLEAAVLVERRDHRLLVLARAQASACRPTRRLLRNVTVPAGSSLRAAI